MSASDAVLKYLRDQNRPYSANDIVQNLHNEFNKAAVQKALDHLAESKSILEKTYGKQKVYCIIQEEASNKEDFALELQHINSRLSEGGENLRKVLDELKSAGKTLQDLESQPTTEEAEKKVIEAESRVSELKDRLHQLRVSQLKVCKEDKDKVEKIFQQLQKEYRKRKRICTDIVDSVLEGYPKSKKTLLEEIGIETDEDVGFKLP